MHHQNLVSRQGNEDAVGLEMALFSLKKMASGGVYDHLGGGIYRYSVDDYWMIPHFEKMLYDNGPLLNIYCDAWQLSTAGLLDNGLLVNENKHIETAERTIHSAWFRLRNMPVGHASLLLALEDMLFSPQIIVLRGTEIVIKEWQIICQKHYAPHQCCLAIDRFENLFNQTCTGTT